MKIREALFYLIIPIVLVLLTLLLTFARRSLVISPGDQSYKFNPYSDSFVMNGQSEFRGELVNDSFYRYVYTLREGIPYPYGGFTISHWEPGLYFFLEKYDYAKLRINTTVSQSIFFNLYIYSEELEELGFQNPLFFIEHEVPTKHGLEEYILEFRDFSTPLWWYEDNGIIAADVSLPSRDLTVNFDIGNSTLLPLDVEDTILFYEVSFHRKKWKDLLMGLLALTVYSAFLFLRFWKKRKRMKYVVYYRALETDESPDSEFMRLSRFISENYQNEGLSLTMVSDNLGISAFKLSAMIKEELKLTFPQYLNGIRLAEAERQLLSTDRQITEIALAVGYNTITHFNKVFKDKNGLTPLQFRKIRRKS